ncbi:pleckstrin homology domain-containing family G member 4B isoform X1 [Ursus americanus]|uniref:pleckstrin homology domain-containing family G member 4B isoform X1 n=1 Tax=Ursus americanus TaxID=9643 RepID=UPI001E67A1A7|nr:pleckstrin homology domain-containing family G member 4B isoform X1 [Ursus americanus]XP_045663998.1 pleckstrin homology domain-containing family G member 4B isoform X1 [Ursus americanus]
MALSAADGGSGTKDLESLDAYIQNTLSALYPPFEATAATVLWQLFSVAERLHGGDGLRCLTDFLIPAKRALQHLQQEACARYTGLIFFHEGWPLCIHEKVVVQLASLRGVRLRPGDFYLQVTSVGKQSARLVLKCLSQLGRGSEEVTVPEAMYSCVFTGEFLEWLNGERNSVPLQNCLLTSGSAVFRTPWSNVTDPIFVPTFRTVLPPCSCPGPEQPPSRSTSRALAAAPAMANTRPWETTPSSNTPTPPHCHRHPGSDQSSHQPSPGRAGLEGPRSPFGSSNGGLIGVGPSQPGPCEGPRRSLDATDKRDGPQALTVCEDRGSPSCRRQLPRDPACMESRRWFRKSYMEALRNPMPLGSSSEESLGEEACSSQTTGARAAASPTEKEMPSSWGDPVESSHQEKRPGATRSTLPRRSRSWDRSLRSWRGDTRRASQHSVSSRLGGLLGGQAEGTRSAGSSCPPCTPAESPAGVDGDSSTFRGHDPGRISDVLVEPLCPERGGQPPSTGDVPNQAPRQVLEVSQELLHSGVITLPGTRDHQGRAVVQVCARGPLWSSKHTSSFELTRLLQYFHSIPRKEVQELGLVILVDAREGPAAPALFQALTALQNASPSIIHSIVMLVNKESGFRPDKDGTIQCEVVGSLKALHKLVDSSQLTADLDGSFPYSHSDWISFRRKLEPFTTNCKDAIVFLQNSVHSLNTPRTLSTAQEVTDLIGKHKATMKFVLEDALLVALRLEGGTMLAQLRREQLGTSQDCRDAIEVTSRLYDQVDEEVHRLVLASNRCLQELEGLREVRTLQEGQGHVDGGVQQCAECLEHLGPEPVTEYLKSCHQEATELTAQSFPGASTVAAGLGSQRALRQWHALGLQSPQTRLCFQEALSEVSPDPGSPPLDQRPLKHELARAAERRHCEPSWMPPTDPEGHAGEQAHLLPGLPGQASLCRQEGEHLAPGVPSPHDSPTYSSEPNQTPTTHPRKHPLKKIMRKTRSFEIAQLDSGPRDAHWPGHTGVFIRGLEVTSTMASEKKPPPRPHAESPLVTRNRSLSSPSRTHRSEEDRRRQAGSSRLQHIMAEMLSTEREYVRSLGYVIDNYFPEMERTDLPQDLRGKRSVVFGNLEKLYDFHRQHFLAELERCQHCPLAAGRGFLRHEEQFGMYALYSKNKPQSDALLCSHGNAFFKVIPPPCEPRCPAPWPMLTLSPRPLQDKQRELGDKMDLASYLLKPVQRMGKYALLLQDLVREAGCCPAWEQELGELRAAEDVVRFQLRHGNDLLAMDAVRGCDVNLKEQGQLRCQDEFIVCCGRRKSLRHVFLFEDLILFSKTKKVDGGYDTYTYKQSFKTAEIGMTENVGDSGLRFEIWFRRRRKSQDTYILQASSAEVKTAWTHVIGQILWRQALRNREVRMQEMVSMGIGDKPFTDIQPSNAAISDRAVKKGAESWTRAPVVVPPSDHAAPFKRPHSTISDSSTSSSGSQSSALGPLSLQACASPALLSSAYCPWPYDMRTCLEEEDELEQETGSPPSMLTEGTSSGTVASGFQGCSLRRATRAPPLLSPGGAHSHRCIASTPRRCDVFGRGSAPPGRIPVRGRRGPSSQTCA